jgi:hypothetical protein
MFFFKKSDKQAVQTNAGQETVDQASLETLGLSELTECEFVQVSGSGGPTGLVPVL